MKKVLIVSLFITLILLVPMTTVVGVSDVEDDCGCQPVRDRQLVRFERLSNRIMKLLHKLEIFTNIVFILSKNNLVIAEKYEDSSNEIVTLKELNEELKTDIIFQDSPFICDILETIINNFKEMYDKYYQKGNEAFEAEKWLLASMYYFLCTICFTIWTNLYFIGDDLGCWGLL